MRLKGQLEARYGIRVWPIVADLAVADAAQALVDRLKTEGLTIDVLVNNAGFGNYGPFLTTDWPRLQAMLTLNIVTLSHLTHLLLPDMVARGGGKILNLASTAAFQPGPFMAVYFATKAYVLLFSEAIANELQGTGVTVTALCPGPTVSEFQTQAKLDASPLFSSTKLPTAAEVAEFGYRSLQAGQTVAIHGWLNRLLVFVVRFFPRSWVTSMTRSIQEVQPH